MGAGQFHLDIGTVLFLVNKSDVYIDEPAVTLFPVRVRDGNDLTKVTRLQPGAPTEDYDVVRKEDLEAYFGRTSYGVMFPGAVILTPTGQDKILYPFGSVGSTITILALMAHGIKQGSSGTTDLRVSAAARGGSTTNSILLQLSSSNTSGVAYGSFEITARDPLYFFCEDATGGHEDLQLVAIAQGGGIV